MSRQEPLGSCPAVWGEPGYGQQDVPLFGAARLHTVEAYASVWKRIRSVALTKPFLKCEAWNRYVAWN